MLARIDIDKVVLARHTFVGPTRTTHAPNGSATSTDRVLSTVEVFEATFNGTRGKFAGGFKRIEMVDLGRIGPRFGSWSDGHPNRVASWEEAIAAAKEEPTS
jgi:hypothetical protein